MVQFSFGSESGFVASLESEIFLPTPHPWSSYCTASPRRIHEVRYVQEHSAHIARQHFANSSAIDSLATASIKITFPFSYFCIAHLSKMSQFPVQVHLEVYDKRIYSTHKRQKHKRKRELRAKVLIEKDMQSNLSITDHWL